MLPQFYLDYLKTYLPDSELLTLQILVWLLQVHRQVRIERLASSFPYPIKCESRRKKIQRFLVLPRFSLPLLWFPLIKKIINSQFKRPIAVKPIYMGTELELKSFCSSPCKGLKLVQFNYTGEVQV
jgi:hypothetical protein